LVGFKRIVLVGRVACCDGMPHPLEAIMIIQLFLEASIYLLALFSFKQAAIKNPSLSVLYLRTLSLRKRYNPELALEFN
jgi:hypothetical protein